MRSAAEHEVGKIGNGVILLVTPTAGLNIHDKEQKAEKCNVSRSTA